MEGNPCEVPCGPATEQDGRDMKHPDAHFEAGELLQITGYDDSIYPRIHDGVVLVVELGPEVSADCDYRNMTVLHLGRVYTNWSAMEEDWGNDMERL